MLVSNGLSTGLKLTHAVNVVKKVCAIANLLHATDLPFFQFFCHFLSSGNQQKDRAAIV